MSEIIQPPPKINVEEVFNEFVEDFGGELVSKLLRGLHKLPLNADYFFQNRTIIAELKCLEKNYFNDENVGKKLNLAINRWYNEGLLLPKNIKDNVFQTDDLPIQCSYEILDIFSLPVREAIKSANKQIKETKKFFELPNAKGLLILVNDGNYALSPRLMMNILGNILVPRYTGIDSFIYFTPNLWSYAPQIDRQFIPWVDGRSRPTSNEVERSFLSSIYKSWISFTERKTGEMVTQFKIKNHDLIEDIKLIF